MKTYTVVIKATIQKCIEVDARDAIEAEELACGLFNTDDGSFMLEILDVDDVTDFRRKVA